MERKTLSILNKVAKGKMTPEVAKQKLFKLFDIDIPFCNPPNITYCKQSIYPDFDCETCKWKLQNNKQKHK